MRQTNAKVSQGTQSLFLFNRMADPTYPLDIYYICNVSTVCCLGLKTHTGDGLVPTRTPYSSLSCECESHSSLLRPSALSSSGTLRSQLLANAVSLLLMHRVLCLEVSQPLLPLRRHLLLWRRVLQMAVQSRAMLFSCVAARVL